MATTVAISPCAKYKCFSKPIEKFMKRSIETHAYAHEITEAKARGRLYFVIFSFANIGNRQGSVKNEKYSTTYLTYVLSKNNCIITVSEASQFDEASMKSER